MVQIGDTVCPVVWMFVDEGYIMSYMEPVVPYPHTICVMETILASMLWHRGPLRPECMDWPALLKERVGIREIPSWVLGYRPCATHGDCTVSNALVKMGEIYIGDALPQPRHVASCMEVDMSRLLQSAAGWETLVHGDEFVEYEMPHFWGIEEVRRRAIWWLGVLGQRLLRTEMQREEKRAHVILWCNETSKRAFELCA